jgi:hypothetical protein
MSYKFVDKFGDKIFGARPDQFRNSSSLMYRVHSHEISDWGVAVNINRFLAPRIPMDIATHVPSLCDFMVYYRANFTFRGLHLINLGKVSLEE